MEPETKPSLSARISVWRRRVREILASFWVIVVSSFSKLRAPKQHRENTIPPENTPGKETRDGEVKPPIVTNIEPPPGQGNQPDRNKEQDPLWKKIAEICIAASTVGLLVVTGAYTIVSYQQWQTAKNSFSESQKQTTISQQQLEATVRPWIKIIDVQTRGNGPIIPALSFQNGTGAGKPFQQATFQLKVSLKNIGHSVAEVTVRPDLFFPLWDTFGKTVPDEQKRFCDSDLGKARSGWYPSTILFPDESFDWYGAGAQIIDSNNTTHIGNAAYVLPVVVVCVNYRLKSLPNTYQSSAIYEVFRKDNRTRFFEPGVGVPADKILLIRNPVDDFAY